MIPKYSLEKPFRDDRRSLPVSSDTQIGQKKTNGTGTEINGITSRYEISFSLKNTPTNY